MIRTFDSPVNLVLSGFTLLASCNSEKVIIDSIIENGKIRAYFSSKKIRLIHKRNGSPLNHLNKF